MVDTLDLSPSEPQGSYRFDSVLRYQLALLVQRIEHDSSKVVMVVRFHHRVQTYHIFIVFGRCCEIPAVFSYIVSSKIERYEY